jgi:hypothetical protein
MKRDCEKSFGEAPHIDRLETLVDKDSNADGRRKIIHSICPLIEKGK